MTLLLLVSCAASPTDTTARPGGFFFAKDTALTQSAWTRDGRPVDAATISSAEWDLLKQTALLGEFVMPCCKAPAVLKTSINGLPFFAHLSDECATAPETKWHKGGKAAVLAALDGMGIMGREEVPGSSSSGGKWEADVLFSFHGRTIVIELQRSYQHLRDFIRRQERYAASSVECYWLVRAEAFITLGKATTRLLLKRDYGNVFPPGGIGTGMLPELPVAMLNTEGEQRVLFGGLKTATVSNWLAGILDGTYQYRGGSWNLG
ncbi:hypothetical protein BLA13014_04604 [Burkholderia aenigmatica]|uniref:Competence protein CoiA nuclease-like domain-containing protein n=1 Tax=Burkholderia aenigmatica TaxID=2015348 RepID=A0A6P2NTR9_9BURK|nr:hypothetical protein BLA13014_04604 [Burkholderia aenigmatica]